MIRTKNVCGFFVFLLTITLLWFGIIVINYCCILYWFREPNIKNRWIRAIPTDKIGTVIFLIFNLLGYFASVAHLRASFCDPGVVTNEIQAPPEIPLDEIKDCKRWSLIWKPIRAHHCSECNVWIFKMDHHCPWINNWVGIKNTKYFFLFTLYTGVGAILSIWIIITWFVMLLRDTSNNHALKPGYPVAFFLWILVLVESILFSFFTLELVGEQFELFQDNQTYVDDMKDLTGVPLSFFESLRVWIGQDWLFWLIPTYPVLEINYAEKLYSIKDLMSGKYKAFNQIDYDPERKQRAVSMRDSKKDKMCFGIFTAFVVVSAYYLAL